MGKYSKVSSSTERRLGEKVILRLMECLTPTVSFDIFRTISHLSVCLPTLELTSFEKQVCSSTQMQYHREQTTAKKKKKKKKKNQRRHFEQRASGKKAA